MDGQIGEALDFFKVSGEQVHNDTSHAVSAMNQQTQVMNQYIKYTTNQMNSQTDQLHQDINGATQQMQEQSYGDPVEVESECCTVM